MDFIERIDPTTVASLTPLAESDEFAMFAVGQNTYVLVQRRAGTPLDGPASLRRRSVSLRIAYGRRHASSVPGLSLATITKLSLAPGDAMDPSLSIPSVTFERLVLTHGPSRDENGEFQSFTRSFGTTTSDLLTLSDWLASYGVTLVGMESTGVYWKPDYTLLETEFECWLLNAQHLRNVPGRKTDVADAAWIAQLVAHGLVRPSFVPPKEIRELRELTRCRKALIQERTREAQRLHKIIEGSGIKLATVATGILGVSGRAMLNALIGGTHDPDLLAELARGKLRKKLPALRKALSGWFSPTHRLLVSELLAHLEYIDESIERLSADVEGMIAPFARDIDLLDTIPGVKRRTTEVIISEVGTDMSRFGSGSRLVSWAGMCPGNNESAGKHFSGKTRKGSKWLRIALTEAAQAAARTKGTYFAAQYARIKGRHGHNKAIVAVAHSILVIVYHLLERDQPYNELGGDYFIERQQKDAYQRRLVKQLERMGYEVALTKHAA
jgi:transposase